jgi:hypothetical protein
VQGVNTRSTHRQVFVRATSHTHLHPDRPLPEAEDELRPAGQLRAVQRDAVPGLGHQHLGVGGTVILTLLCIFR